jgi:hypothetical protein
MVAREGRRRLPTAWSSHYGEKAHGPMLKGVGCLEARCMGSTALAEIQTKSLFHVLFFHKYYVQW